jgi:hypothetical protein
MPRILEQHQPAWNSLADAVARGTTSKSVLTVSGQRKTVQCPIAQKREQHGDHDSPRESATSDKKATYRASLMRDTGSPAPLVIRFETPSRTSHIEPSPDHGDA